MTQTRVDKAGRTTWRAEFEREAEDDEIIAYSASDVVLDKPFDSVLDAERFWHIVAWSQSYVYQSCFDAENHDIVIHMCCRNPPEGP